MKQAKARVFGDRFRELELKGSGGEGVCYLVERMADQALFILKIRVAYTLSDANEALREVFSLCRVTSPYVCTYMDAFLEDHPTTPDAWNVCLVTEFYEGGDLLSFLMAAEAEDLSPDPATAVAWVTQLCLGLQAIHKQGIVHRDVKTENIFIGSDAAVCIGDFGLARNSLVNEKIDGKAQGTWNYMAPEQVNKAPYDEKVDIWGLGIICLEIATGKTLFSLFGDACLAEELQNPSWDGLEVALAAVPSNLASLAGIVNKCLTLDPGKRPSADLLLHDILFIKATSASQAAAALGSTRRSSMPLHASPVKRNLRKYSMPVGSEDSAAAGHMDMEDPRDDPLMPPLSSFVSTEDFRWLMPQTIWCRPLTASCIPAASQVLTQAYVHNPFVDAAVSSLSFDEATRFLTNMLFPAILKYAIRMASPCWGVYDRKELVAVAVWLPPNADGIPPRSVFKSSVKFRGPLSKLTKMTKAMAKRCENSFPSNTWFLWWLGVREGWRRRGHATLLIRKLLAWVDHESSPVASLVFDEQHSKILMKFGFKVDARFFLGSNGPSTRKKSLPSPLEHALQPRTSRSKSKSRKGATSPPRFSPPIPIAAATSSSSSDLMSSSLGRFSSSSSGGGGATAFLTRQGSDLGLNSDRSTSSRRPLSPSSLTLSLSNLRDANPAPASPRVRAFTARTHTSAPAGAILSVFVLLRSARTSIFDVSRPSTPSEDAYNARVSSDFDSFDLDEDPGSPSWLRRKSNRRASRRSSAPGVGRLSDEDEEEDDDSVSPPAARRTSHSSPSIARSISIADSPSSESPPRFRRRGLKFDVDERMASSMPTMASPLSEMARQKDSGDWEAVTPDDIPHPPPSEAGGRKMSVDSELVSIASYETSRKDCLSFARLERFRLVSQSVPDSPPGHWLVKSSASLLMGFAPKEYLRSPSLLCDQCSHPFLHWSWCPQACIPPNAFRSPKRQKWTNSKRVVRDKLPPLHYHRFKDCLQLGKELLAECGALPSNPSFTFLVGASRDPELAALCCTQAYLDPNIILEGALACFDPVMIATARQMIQSTSSSMRLRTSSLGRLANILKRNRSGSNTPEPESPAPPPLFSEEEAEDDLVNVSRSPALSATQNLRIVCTSSILVRKWKRWLRQCTYRQEARDAWKTWLAGQTAAGMRLAGSQDCVEGKSPRSIGPRGESPTRHSSPRVGILLSPRRSSPRAQKTAAAVLAAWEVMRSPLLDRLNEGEQPEALVTQGLELLAVDLFSATRDFMTWLRLSPDRDSDTGESSSDSQSQSIPTLSSAMTSSPSPPTPPSGRSPRSDASPPMSLADSPRSPRSPPISRSPTGASGHGTRLMKGIVRMRGVAKQGHKHSRHSGWSGEAEGEECPPSLPTTSNDVTQTSTPTSQSFTDSTEDAIGNSGDMCPPGDLGLSPPISPGWAKKEPESGTESK